MRSGNKIKNKKISYSRHNSKFKYQNRCKMRNRYPQHTITWLVAFLAVLNLFY